MPVGLIPSAGARVGRDLAGFAAGIGVQDDDLCAAFTYVVGVIRICQCPHKGKEICCHDLLVFGLLVNAAARRGASTPRLRLNKKRFLCFLGRSAGVESDRRFSAFPSNYCCRFRSPRRPSCLLAMKAGDELEYEDIAA